MHARSGPIVAAVLLGFACSAAQAQTIHVSVQDIALRNGESVVFGNVYLVGADCRSLLTVAPEVEVMDGPPGVAVVVREAMVVPFEHGCSRSVQGGQMIITAKDIDAYSYTRMVLQITYQTQSGKLQRSQHINLALFP